MKYRIASTTLILSYIVVFLILSLSTLTVVEEPVYRTDKIYLDYVIIDPDTGAHYYGRDYQNISVLDHTIETIELKIEAKHIIIGLNLIVLFIVNLIVINKIR